MKFRFAAISCAILTATAAIWRLEPSTAIASISTSPVGEAISHADLRPRGLEIRRFLTNAQIQEALASGAVDRPIKSLLATKATLQFGQYIWNEKDVPTGRTWIRIDLRSQLISVFRAGHEIGTAVIVYGGDDKETPIGKLRILAKTRDHQSSLYDAEMPYTLRLTQDGVSIHASSVRRGTATHGCIGVPLPFARRLFEATFIGDEVVIGTGPVQTAHHQGRPAGIGAPAKPAAAPRQIW
jgi:hypothetical protein